MAERKEKFNYSSLESMRKLVRSAGDDPLIDPVQLGEVNAKILFEQEESRVWGRRDRGFKTKQTAAALDVFNKMFVDDAGNTLYPAVFEYLERQHKFAIDRQAKPSVLAKTGERVVYSAQKAGKILSKKHFSREFAVFAFAISMVAFGVSRGDEVNASLERTYASIDQRCVETLPNANVLALQEGVNLSPDDEKEYIKVCNDELRARMYDDENILDKERLLRLGYALMIWTGALGALNQVCKAGSGMKKRFSNNKASALSYKT